MNTTPAIIDAEEIINSDEEIIVDMTAESVRIRAPYARSDEQDLIVGVNGVNWSIPQDGKEHDVPPAVAWELLRSEREKRKFYQTQERLLKNSKII